MLQSTQQKRGTQRWLPPTAPLMDRLNTSMPNAAELRRWLPFRRFQTEGIGTHQRQKDQPLVMIAVRGTIRRQERVIIRQLMTPPVA